MMKIRKTNPRYILLILGWLSINSCNGGLSVVTANTIQGTAPYLTFDNGTTKETDTSPLLKITLSDGTELIPTAHSAFPSAVVDSSSASSPIVLPNTGDTFADITTFVPLASYPSITLETVVKNNGYWHDNDGDSLPSITPSSKINIKWQDKNGNDITEAVKLNPSSIVSSCNAPYKLTISADAGTLSTQYGDPQSSNFANSSHIYYIKPKGAAGICYAKPNKNEGIGAYAGEPSVWHSTKGFITQATFAENFPTTGASTLHFDLNVAGINATSLIWSPVTVGEITATPAVMNNSTVKVTLTGPSPTQTQRDAVNPGPILAPTLPAEFVITGTDSIGDIKVFYGFKINKWYINRSNSFLSATEHESWCRDTVNYQLVKVSDLTNASGGLWVGATPSSGNNHYKRHVGGGLLTEWGDLNIYHYSTSGFWTTNVNWTSDKIGTDHFHVDSHKGIVANKASHYQGYAICVTK